MHLINTSLNHALRVPLAAEIHSRPFLQLDAPDLITHLAVYSTDQPDAGVANLQAQHATLAALCTHGGVTGPSSEAKYF